ncbi:MAG: hypothetical protein KatS3mg030_302 [Saprospiraceae bacterium]|nr:MAG: hypothetical protein KatS3mg030_302 [Saprospiraceae bacterium]
MGLWLWRKLAPTYDVLIRREEAFYRALLSRLDASRPVLFDIGAHEGWIAKVFMEYSERVVAAEPDPFARWIMRNRFGKKNADRLVIVGKAMSNDQGRATMFVQQRGSDPIHSIQSGKPSSKGVFSAGPLHLKKRSR